MDTYEKHSCSFRNESECEEDLLEEDTNLEEAEEDFFKD